MKTFNIVTIPGNMPERFLRNVGIVLVTIFIGLIAVKLIVKYYFNIRIDSFLLLVILFASLFFIDKIIGLKLKIIGKFSFNDLRFEKSVGDLIWSIDIEKIRQVNIEKHLVYIMPFIKKTMYRTFEVSITSFDGTSEKFIVDNDNGLFMNEIKKLKLNRPDLVKIGKL